MKFDPQQRIFREDHFNDREIGLTHPDLPSFIKLNDAGQIEIFATEGVGIVLDPHTRSIILVGDRIKILTNEYDGIRWNNKSFNSNATSFAEPFLLPVDPKRDSPIRGVIDD